MWLKIFEDNWENLIMNYLLNPTQKSLTLICNWVKKPQVVEIDTKSFSISTSHVNNLHKLS